jgi:thiol:disulfide interchange protein DsbC
MKRLLIVALLCWNAAGAAEPADTSVRFADLPFDLAVTQVRGSGRRVFVTFEDPDCVYCKRLARELAGMSDVTIHTFVYPILSADSKDKARALRCASNRAQAWNDWMIRNIPPRAAKCDDDASERVLALGRRLHVRATPTIFLADGERLVGSVSKMELEVAISSPQVLSAQGK